MVPGGGRAVVAGLSGSSTSGRSSRPLWAGWSGRDRARWAEGGGEQLVVAGLPGPVPRKVQAESSGGGGDPGRDVDQLGADRGGAGLGVEGSGEDAGGAG